MDSLRNHTAPVGREVIFQVRTLPLYQELSYIYQTDHLQTNSIKQWLEQGRRPHSTPTEKQP
jgi:hypothetical protein